MNQHTNTHRSLCSMASAFITEATAREAFVMYAQSKCCYRTAPAEDMVITNMEDFKAYRYRLVTFRESRSTKQCFTPYIGQQVESFRGVPCLWDILVQTPAFFKEGKEVIKIPHTSVIKKCGMCFGRGNNICTGCAGFGKMCCTLCGGTGTIWINGMVTYCTMCFGQGTNMCLHCSGRGSRVCLMCLGHKKIVEYTKLSVKWTNHTDECVVEPNGLIGKKLSKVSGKKINMDTKGLVSPVVNFADSAVVAASKRLVREHQALHSKYSHIQQQRQTIERIPITRVSYTWKEKSSEFFVFGKECQMTTDNYPATCCCAIL